MDRISDSGSDDMGSTPFEDTFKCHKPLIATYLSMVFFVF